MKLLTVLAGLSLSALSSAQSSLIDVTFAPASASPGDFITAQINGEFPTPGYTNSGTQMTIAGSSITINLAFAKPAGTVIQIITPFTLAAPIGRLPAGAYSVVFNLSIDGARVDSTMLYLAIQTGPPVSIVNATSFSNSIAPSSIVTAFGSAFSSTSTQSVDPFPTELAGTTISVTDASRQERLAQLLYVSPNQINFVVPELVTPGSVLMTIRTSAGQTLYQTARAKRTAPGLFTADGTGGGVAAALAVRIATDGTQSVAPVFQCLGSSGCLPSAIDFGSATDQTALMLFGTGIRGRTALTNVACVTGEIAATVLYAGSQNQYAGLDQVNVLLPATLRGRGEVNLVLVVDGQPANQVKIKIK